ncbi:hypothetical protein EYZ11_011376 [Aspergillus tanneri]|uniref:Uncharacterized protein n=1 Tax=Aspergillus tanneri TaxID=1220188 RepID=A0A4S3J3A8_9EURO|nr:hypothetical protein EYZ11_011376 [Aspergillus tanneri]
MASISRAARIPSATYKRNSAQ